MNAWTRWSARVLLVAWCGATWLLSSKSDPEAYVGVRIRLPDKVEHFIEYAVGGALAAAAFGPWRGGSRFATAAVFATAWGATDEFHQAHVPGRDASAFDLLADAAGACTGAALASEWVRRRQAAGAPVDERDDRPKEGTPA